MTATATIETTRLAIGDGDEGFTLLVRPPTDAEAVAIGAALAEGCFAACQLAIRPLVVGWEGVNGPDGGPVPFTDNDGRSNLGRFLGSVPFALQMRVLFAVLQSAGADGALVERLWRRWETAVVRR